MVSGVESLCLAADFKCGDRVASLRGSLHGTVREVLDDGRLRWQTDDGVVLIALPESLRREE